MGYQTVTLSEKGVWFSMLSTLSVTSGRIVSDVEAKPTSFIETNIFNNGLQFIIVEEETFTTMISAVRNVSRY